MNYSFESTIGSLKLGVITGINTNTFASKTVTFNINEEIITFGREILVGRSKSVDVFVPSYIGTPALFGVSGETKYRLLSNYSGSGSIFVDIFSRNYDFKYKGRGSLNLNDDKKLTNTQGFRAPYKASGTFTISGIGGYNFEISQYISIGSLSLYGDSLNRKISVYGYYGDSGEFATSGSIAISQQTSLTREKLSKSYSGSGEILSTSVSDLKKSYAYGGNGNISISGTTSESTSINSPNNVQLFTFSNSSQNSFSKPIITDTPIYSISGYSSSKVVYSNISSVQISINGSSTNNQFILSPTTSTALFRFTRYDVDNTYDTCDSEDIKCDNQDSATSKVSFSPSQGFGLFAFDGASNTQINSTYSYNALSTYQLSGSYSGFKFSYSDIGSGSLYALSSYNAVDTKNYTGQIATLNILGSSQSSVTRSSPSSGHLYTIFGNSLAKIESEYFIDSSGLINFGGFGSTRKLSVYSKVGLVDFNLYGELNYPDVRFVPSTVTGGSINISGYSEESITKLYVNTFNTLFNICFGFESFSKSSYVGIGSIYVQEINALTINNPYQIPRTYVSII